MTKPVLSVGTFTLTANATSTTVTDAAVSPGCTILLTPITPDSANDRATTSVVAGAGSFVVTHANNPRADRSFDYAVIGP